MSLSDIDQVVIDLKVIASLKQNIKLITKGCYLNSEQPHVVPEWIRRWFRGDSRDNTIKRIDETVMSAIESLGKGDNIYKTKIKQHLKDSITGIDNLKKTYSDCVQTNARLNAVIDKINSAISESENSDSNTFFNE